MKALRHLLHRVTTPGQRRFLKFCIVGASGVPVNLAVTWLGHAVLFSNLSVDWRNAASFLLGIAISIFTNFLLNDLWTWGDHRKASEHNFLGRLARFYLVCSLTSGIQFGAAMAITTWIALHYLVAQLIGIALATAVNFAVNNLWTFKNKDAETSPAPASAQESSTE